MRTKQKSGIKVSFGNKKLPKGTMIVNIPAVVTCPLKTSLCEQICYAKKAERLYPAVLPAREHNLKLIRAGKFRHLMVDSIIEHYHKIDIIRIHESGDFFNQGYVNDWFSVAEQFPEFTFYAYTKSFHLDYSKKPKNFVLIASFDDSTDKLRLDAYNKIRKQFNNTFTIVPRGQKADCIADCVKCNKCWTKTGLNITVNKH